jgi:hypothetical protein
MRRYFCLATAFAATALAADIPIREIVLYKSGVGYFERGGLLRAGESALVNPFVAPRLDVAPNAKPVSSRDFDAIGRGNINLACGDGVML